MFSEAESEYLKSQRMAHIATVSANGQPDLVPVEFKYDGKYLWVGSHNDRARKHRNVLNGNKLVAITVDDVESVQPWKARMIRIYGTAEITSRQGHAHGQALFLKIEPKRSWSFGIEPNKNPGWAISKRVHK